MDDPNPALTERNLTTLRSLLSGCVVQSANLRYENRFQPAAESILGRELAGVDYELAGEWGSPPKDGPLRQTYLTALTSLAAVDQHLQALEVLAQTSITLSSEVVVRAAIEAAARAWWLLDPDVDGRARVARGMTERLYSMRESVKVLADMGSGRGVGDDERRRAASESAEAERQRIQGRMDRVVRTATEKDFEVLPDRKGRPEAIGERRPRATPLIESFYSATSPLGSVLFRSYSAKAHATLYGLMNALSVIPVPDAADKIGVFETSPRDREIGLIVSMMAHNYANDRLVQLTGWSDWGWAGWRKHVTTRIFELLDSRDPSRSTEP